MCFECMTGSTNEEKANSQRLSEIVLDHRRIRRMELSPSFWLQWKKKAASLYCF